MLLSYTTKEFENVFRIFRAKALEVLCRWSSIWDKNWGIIGWLSCLGQGGFADVYLGEHIYLQTPAAIKVLQMRLTDEALGKFLAEARTIARFSHPNIVSVLEFGIENATPFLVMSYAPYGSLRERHPRGSLLQATMIVSYVEQIATAYSMRMTARLFIVISSQKICCLGRTKC